jgi:hypothetical protein
MSWWWRRGHPDGLRATLTNRTCLECGGRVTSRTRSYCDTCLSEASSGSRQLKQAAASSLQQKALAKWRADGYRRPSPRLFQEEILPLLERVPLSRLVQATGLSQAYCSQIRRGALVPHPRPWAALKELAAAAPNTA